VGRSVLGLLTVVAICFSSEFLVVMVSLCVVTVVVFISSLARMALVCWICCGECCREFSSDRSPIKVVSHLSQRHLLRTSNLGFVARIQSRCSEKNLSPLSAGNISVRLNGTSLPDTPTASANLLMWFSSE